MRPSGITDGIIAEARIVDPGRKLRGLVASMRPSGITDGIYAEPSFEPATHASMRPSSITDGISRSFELESIASMRPSGITDGISEPIEQQHRTRQRSFNEAVGYYRRNQ